MVLIFELKMDSRLRGNDKVVVRGNDRAVVRGYDGVYIDINGGYWEL